MIELAKLRKVFMPSVDTRGQQQSRVVEGRGTHGQLLTPHHGNAPASHSKCLHVQQGTAFAAFVAKSEQLVHGCTFICSLDILKGMYVVIDNDKSINMTHLNKKSFYISEYLPH